MNHLLAWAKIITYLHWVLVALGMGVVAVVAFNPSVSVWSSLCALGIVTGLLIHSETDRRANGDELQKDIAHSFVNVVAMDFIFIGIAVFFQLQKSLTIINLLVWIGSVLLVSVLVYALIYLLRAVFSGIAVQ